jgi:DNA mismatch endonuclease, patch repair protein
MADVLTPEQRSYCMSRIRGANTAPEVAFRKALWSLGFRYRISNRMPGRPDILFRRARIAVFVDGCFWHGCKVHFVMPRTRRTFWKKKIESNISRDRRVRRQLRQSGWRVVRVWEHEIENRPVSALRRIVQLLRGAGERQK